MTRMRKCGKCEWGSDDMCEKCFHMITTEEMEVGLWFGNTKIILQLWRAYLRKKPLRRWFVEVLDEKDTHKKRHVGGEYWLQRCGPFGTSKAAENYYWSLQELFEQPYNGDGSHTDIYKLLDSIKNPIRRRLSLP